MSGDKLFKKVIEESSRVPPMLKRISIRKESNPDKVADLSTTENTFFKTSSYQVFPHHKPISKVVKK